MYAKFGISGGSPSEQRIAVVQVFVGQIHKNPIIQSLRCRGLETMQREKSHNGKYPVHEGMADNKSSITGYAGHRSKPADPSPKEKAAETAGWATDTLPEAEVGLPQSPSHSVDRQLPR